MYHTWLQCKSYWEIGDTIEPRRCHNKIRALITKLKEAFPCSPTAKCHHLSTSKTHEKMHMVASMIRWGGSIHHEASTGEANRCFFAKGCALP